MLTVHVLGRPESYLEDQTPVVPPTPMGETIYYYLVCERQPVTHAHIANLFWSNMATSEALAEWHTLLPTLHNAFGAYLKSTADQVAFNYQMDHRVDLYDLQYILLDDKIPARQKLEKIRTLYRGALLAETEERNDTDFGQWLHQHRQAIQRRVGEALQGLTEYFLQQDDFVFGFKTTRWWLTLEPGNEVAHRLRMNLFWRSKQRSAALLQYHICRSDLDSYFGSEPSAQTTELYLQILHEAVPGAPTRRVRANRIANPDIHNLPRRLTSFAGREKEIAALHRYLLEERQRMVVIMGEGGVGKTGLALVAVEKILTNDKTAPYLDGIWFVSCAGIEAAANAAELLSINIGSAIGIQFRGAKTPFEQLSDYLASKTMLLILDNVEHLEPQISLLFTLLNRAPNLQLLLTSRHQLAIRHYQSLRSDGLETPIAAQEAITRSLSNEELAQLLATPSIQILSDRTRKIWPQFVINQENGVAAARLCRLLDGNPLAIELAATLIVEYDLAALVAELTRNYTLLAGDLQDLPPRQRSIYNTIDYTWRMFPP